VLIDIQLPGKENHMASSDSKTGTDSTKGEFLRWLKDYWALVAAILAAVVYVLIWVFRLDVEHEVLAACGALGFFLLWLTWRLLSKKPVIRVVLSFVIAVLVVLLGYVVIMSSQPTFEIRALNTLEGDTNTYELTDQLIWNQDELDKHGVTITFTIQVLPKYSGTQRFGQVVALISGDSDGPSLEIPLWDDFTSDSSTRQIHLTLPQVLSLSGLQLDSDPPNNLLGPEPHFEQAKLIVRIAPESDKKHTWSSDEIVLYNGPWEFRSELVWRGGGHELDVYTRNWGEAGEFAFRYRLVYLEPDISSSSHPMNSGTTQITEWCTPGGLFRLERGQVHTETIPLPSGLAQGRYLLEAYALKKQDYVQFTDSNITFDDCTALEVAWWFRSSFDYHIFLITAPQLEVAPEIQAEWERLRNEEGIDLGSAIGQEENVTSAKETTGKRQKFEEGEIYIHSGQAYALYGPILEYYRTLDGVNHWLIGFPTSPIQAVTSSSGIEGKMVRCEGPVDYPWPCAIYASGDSAATVWGWDAQRYFDDFGGHSGWLGFPLTSERGFAEGRTIQLFENGYMVYYGGQPLAYSYLTSCGTLFDVYADQEWQDTGVSVQSGDFVTVVQIDGEWTYREPGIKPFDANGSPIVQPPEREGSPLPSVLIGSLIGKVGKDGSPVFIGRWGTLAVQTDGVLYLVMNDNSHTDNTGHITVQILVEPSD
jgi:hypothetical protein